MTLEEEALLGTKNVPASNDESRSRSCSSTRMLGIQVSTSYRDTTSSVQLADDKPHVHVEFVEGLPIWRAALLVANSALGAGILNFPQAYAECSGIATAFTIQMVSVVSGKFEQKSGLGETPIVVSFGGRINQRFWSHLLRCS